MDITTPIAVDEGDDAFLMRPSRSALAEGVGHAGLTEGRIKKAPADEPQGQAAEPQNSAEEERVRLSEPGQADQWCWISVADAFQPTLDWLRGKR